MPHIYGVRVSRHTLFIFHYYFSPQRESVAYMGM